MDSLCFQSLFPGKKPGNIWFVQGCLRSLHKEMMV
jgi:hypothetical protein